MSRFSSCATHPGEPEEGFEKISREKFFDIFEKNKLTFLYQDRKADGSENRFFKFVRRE